MPTMRRKPRGLTNRGTPYTGWHRAMEETFGRGWWNNKALRREVAIESARARGPRFAPGVTVGRVGVKFQIDASQLDRRIRQLPERMALTIQRKAMRRGLVVWQRALQGMFGRHRTDYARPHLGDHVAVVSRVYRRGKRRVVWGAVGIRKGAASGKQIERAIKSTTAQGVDSRGTYGNLFGKNARYFRELPGWRLHFLESGAYSRRRAGAFYFVKAMDALGGTVSNVIQQEIQRLVSETVR